MKHYEKPKLVIAWFENVVDCADGSPGLGDGNDDFDWFRPELEDM